MISALHPQADNIPLAIPEHTLETCEESASIICTLPAFPPLAFRAIELLSGSDFDFDDVVELTNADPSFGAAVVHLANSPLFPARVTIASTRHAVAMLGLERTGSAIMTIALKCYAKRSGPNSAMAQAWRHSLASAIIARELAPAIDLEPHRAYTVALLHDVGRIAMLSAWADEYRSVLASEYDNVIDLLKTEHSALRIDHCTAGSALMKTYRFPCEFTDAAGAHHGPGPDAAKATRLTWLACAAAEALGFGAARIRLSPESGQIAAEVLTDIERRCNLESGEGRAWIQRQIDSAASV